MDPKLILCFVLVSSFYTLVDLKEFCQAFRDNGDKLDFAFRVGLSKEEGPDATNHEVIINGLYWTLLFNDKGKKLQFQRTSESKDCKLSSNHLMAAHFVRQNGIGVVVGFEKNNLKSATILANANPSPSASLSEYKEEKKTSVKGEEIPSQAFIAFSEAIKEKTLPSNVMFVEKKGTGYGVNGFLLKEEGNDLKLERNGGTSSVNAITSIKAPLTLMSVLPIWSVAGVKYGLIFLFKDGSKIRWCWTLGNVLDTDKCNENAEVLIDCTSFTAAPDTTDAPGGGEGGGLTTILMILGVVIVLLVIVAVVVYFLLSQNKKSGEEDLAAASQVSGAQPQLSKRSADVSSNTGSSKIKAKPSGTVPSTGAKSAAK